MSSGVPLPQARGCEVGEPAAKIITPLFPLSENLSGTPLPAATTLTAGKVSTGCWKPPKLYSTVTVKLHDDDLPTASVAVTVTVVVPIGKTEPEALLGVMVTLEQSVAVG